MISIMIATTSVIRSGQVTKNNTITIINDIVYIIERCEVYIVQASIIVEALIGFITLHSIS